MSFDSLKCKGAILFEYGEGSLTLGQSGINWIDQLDDAFVIKIVTLNILKLIYNK